jgi:hypothetical protein
MPYKPTNTFYLGEIGIQLLVFCVSKKMRAVKQAAVQIIEL